MAESSISADSEEAYTTLRRLIPQLAEELDGLRASLREHNVWLQRYGSAPEAPHTAFSSVSPYNPGASITANTQTQPERTSSNDNTSSAGSSTKSPPNYQASSSTNGDSPPPPPVDSASALPPPKYPSAASSATATSQSTPTGAAPPPGYLAQSSSSSRQAQADVPAVVSSLPPTYPAGSSANSTQIASANTDDDALPSYGNTSPPPPAFLPPPPSREEMAQRRDQTAEWLREGEDVLREYSARFAQLGTELQRPFEDVLGTWESSHPDNALPDYERVEEREELMVGGVGEVPPPYVGGAADARGIADNSEREEERPEYGDERDIINQTRRQQALFDQSSSITSPAVDAEDVDPAILTDDSGSRSDSHST